MYVNTCFALMTNIVNTKKDLFVLFEDDKPVLTNSTFNNFFQISSAEEFIGNYKNILNCFTHHPLYFNENKIENNESWFEAILKVPKAEQIVSMVSSDFIPHAFEVSIDESIEHYKIVTFTDITQEMIKRIMTQNNATMDEQTGAYDKDYFIYISKSFEDAAVYNKKVISIISLDTKSDDTDELKKLVSSIQSNIRNDDMLIHWGEGKFLLVHFITNKSEPTSLINKLQDLVNQQSTLCNKSKITETIQEEKESIDALIDRASLQD